MIGDQRNHARIDDFPIAAPEIVDFDDADARKAGDIRAFLEASGAPICPYDILIAAQSRRRGAALVTLNRREFERVLGLLVTDWGGGGKALFRIISVIGSMSPLFRGAVYPITVTPGPLTTRSRKLTCHALGYGE